MKRLFCFVVIVMAVLCSDLGCHHSIPGAEYHDGVHHRADGGSTDTFSSSEPDRPKESCHESLYSCHGHVEKSKDGELHPPKKCGDVKGAICVPGVRKYENGKYTECRQRVFKLAPSCLRSQDLDCDGVPDLGIFGRTSLPVSMKGHGITTFHKIIDVATVDDKSYLFVLVEEMTVLRIELWVVSPARKKEKVLVLRRSSASHGSITINRTFGRIFADKNKQLYFFYCSQPDDQFGQTRNDCKIAVVNVQNLRIDTITVPKVNKKTNILDGYVVFDDTRKHPHLFTLEQVFDEKMRGPTTRSYLQVHALHTEERQIKHIVSSKEHIDISSRNGSSHILLRSKQVGQVIQIMSYSHHILEKENALFYALWIVKYEINNKKIEFERNVLKGDVFLQGPLSVAKSGWNVVLSGPGRGVLTEVTYSNGKWEQSKIKVRNEGFFSGALRNARRLTNRYMMTLKSFYNSSHAELYDSRVFVSLYDRKSQNAYVLDIDRHPMVHSAFLTNTSKGMRLFWLSGSKWILNAPRDRLHSVDIGWCGAKIAP